METRECENCTSEFVIDSEDFRFYEKVGAPLPLYCPQCRAQRRLAWRNERTMYRRTCDLCTRSIVAIYPGSVPWPVYCAPCWWGDLWDPQSFALDYNSTKPFFAQFRELQSKVPRIGLLSLNSEHADKHTHQPRFSTNGQGERDHGH